MGFKYNNAQGGKVYVTRSNYIRFNYGRTCCVSNQDDAGVFNCDNLFNVVLLWYD